MVILLPLCPNQVSLILATHLTWRYKGNKIESWDHFEEPYLRASVRNEKPMGGPAEAPYAPPRVDPGALPFVPMFSESIMLGEHTAPAGSMREEHATTDLRILTVQMSHAAQDPRTAMTAHAVYVEEEIQIMQRRTMGRDDGHGRGHPGGNL